MITAWKNDTVPCMIEPLKLPFKIATALKWKKRAIKIFQKEIKVLSR